MANDSEEGSLSSSRNSTILAPQATARQHHQRARPGTPPERSVSQAVNNTVGILREGRLLFQGPLEQLLVGRAVPVYRLHVREPVRAVAESLSAEDWVTTVEQTAPGWLQIGVRSLSEAEVRLPKALAGCGARVVSLAPRAADLEDVFLELTS